MIRWWPPIALTAMAALGLAVGKGATPIDDWFHQFRHSPGQYLLVLTDPSLLAVVMMAGIAVAFDSRRGRLAATAAVSPIVAWFLVQIFKDMFGRRKDATLAYPSGHITLTVVIWGMVVLVAGAALWSVVTVDRRGRARDARTGRHVALLHRHHRRVVARHRGGVCRGADHQTEVDRCQPGAI